MLRRFGPKSADHPSVGERCPSCGRPFEAGDYTTLVAMAPADEVEAAKMRAGQAYIAVAAEVCWDHAPTIAWLTGEEIQE